MLSQDKFSNQGTAYSRSTSISICSSGPLVSTIAGINKLLVSPEVAPQQYQQKGDTAQPSPLSAASQTPLSSVTALTGSISTNSNPAEVTINVCISIKFQHY